MKKKVIVDGDWGGDEMQLMAVLLSHPEEAEILGACAVFGNTDLKQVVRNAGDILSFLGAKDLPYYVGASSPTGEATLEGDNAHGQNGLGGATLPQTKRPPEKSTAVDFILNTLEKEPEKSITLIGVGPLTNIAQCFIKAPETLRRVKEIIIMGGCTTPMKAADRPERSGNITPYAEFNFYMAARDAKTVLESGLPIILLPMNCTHQLSFTDIREKILREALKEFPRRADIIAKMIAAPHEIDRKKFNAVPIMHDVHTALSFLDPAAYKGKKGHVAITVGDKESGRSHFSVEENGSVLVMEKIKSPDALFEKIIQAFMTCQEK